MNECWRWHRSHTLACFGRNFVCHVTYLLISPQGRPRFELSCHVYLQQPVEFKIVRTENNYEPNSPVDLAQCLDICSAQNVHFKIDEFVYDANNGYAHLSSFVSKRLCLFLLTFGPTDISVSHLMNHCFLLPTTGLIHIPTSQIVSLWKPFRPFINCLWPPVMIYYYRTLFGAAIPDAITLHVIGFVADSINGYTSTLKVVIIYSM